MRTKVALFVAVVLGLVAVFGVHNYLKRTQAQVERKLRPRKMVAASQFIKKGTPLQLKMLMEMEIQEDAVTAEHIPWDRVVTILNQPVNRNIERNQPIFWSFLRAEQEKLDDGLQFGRRALTIAVDNVSGVGGHIRPLSHVDIYGTFNIQEGAARSRGVTKVVRLLSDVTVLAVDTRTRQTESPLATGFTGGRQGYSTVTLDVTPTEAAVLIAAQSAGTVTLALRHSADPGGEILPAEVTPDNLLELARQAEEERQQRLRKATRSTE